MNKNQNSSLAICQEIQRFESVHPSIYAIYDIIELIPDPLIAQQVREHIVCIEDSFVNSQEWTLSRNVPDLRLGILGSINSGKSALVHRYLTGSYMQEESPEGGRFKKEIVIDGNSYLLLIRDEGGHPEAQFTTWVDAIIFVFSLDSESSFNAIYNYYTKIAHSSNFDVPFILVGTQDNISDTSPRVIDEGRARKLAQDLKYCSYYETCATYGYNVDRVFHEACSKVIQQRFSHSNHSESNSHPNTPNLVRYPASTTSFKHPSNGNRNAVNSRGFGHHGNTVSAVNIKNINCSSGSTRFVKPEERKTYSVSSSLDSDNISLARSESFLDSLKRVSAPLPPSGYVPQTTLIAGPLPSHSEINTKENNKNVTNSNNNNKEFITPSSTPTTSRKSRRKSNLFTPNRKTEEKFKNGELGSGRAIPIKQGYLYKKSNKALNKDWRKKYVTLCNDGKLTYHSNLHEYMENSHGKEISLQYTTVKVPGMKPRGSRVVGPTGGAADPQTSEINSLNLASSATLGKTYNGIGFSVGRTSLGPANNNNKDKVLLTSYEAFNNEAKNANNDTKNDTSNVKKRHRRMKSASLKSNESDDADGYEFCIVSLDNKQWNFEASSQEERDVWVSSIEQQILSSLQSNQSHKTKSKQSAADVKVILSIKNEVPGNLYCADCNAHKPEWASINLGLLLCIECSGSHRNLGSHVSKVRSLDLDDWTSGALCVMQSLGNEFGNSIWEGKAAVNCSDKPLPKSDQEFREKWIKRKYIEKEFLVSLNFKDSQSLHEQMVEYVCRGDVRGLASLLPHGSHLVNCPIDRDRDSRTLIHLAAAFPSLPCTQLLLWNNASAKILDSDGKSCLYYAKMAGDREVVDLLLSGGVAGSSPDSRDPIMGNFNSQGPQSNFFPSQSSQGQFLVSQGSQGDFLCPQGSQDCFDGPLQSSTLPRSRICNLRKPDILDKLQASVI